MNAAAAAIPERDAELETLKSLLVGREIHDLAALRGVIDQLQARLGDDDRFRESVARTLVGALRQAEAKQNRELAQALSPVVLAGIRREIVDSRDMMVEALYPITGRLVSTAVARAFRQFVDDVNARLDAALSPRRWRLRMKAMLTGRPFADLVLAEASRFRAEQLMLIDSHSGSMLASWTQNPADAAAAPQTALMGGLISAIVGFSREAFAGDGHDLRALDLGGRGVLLRASGKVIVAAIGRGIIDSDVEAATDKAFLALLAGQQAAEGGAAGETALSALAAELAHAGENAPKRKRSFVLPLIGIALLAGAAFLSWRAYEANRRETRLDARLAGIAASEPLRGQPVTMSRQSEPPMVRVTGLMPDQASLDALKARIESDLPGHAMDLRVVTATGLTAGLAEAERARQARDADLNRALADSGKALSEAREGLSALQARLGEETETRAQLARDVASKLASLEAALAPLNADAAATKEGLAAINAAIMALRGSTQALQEAAPSGTAQVMLRLIDRAVFFTNDANIRDPRQAGETLDAVAALLKANQTQKIRVVGYGDGIGGAANNLAVARLRAQTVARELANRGIEPARLAVIGREVTLSVSDTRGSGSANRRVVFEPVFAGE